MSTSTLGREERKPLMDAFLLERRILFGCTACIGIGLVLWIIITTSDYWMIVSGASGIFLPDTRRYFKSAHSGLWTQCRDILIPHPDNLTFARNFTGHAYFNPVRIQTLKAEIATESYITEFLSLPLTENVDHNFRKHLFANWVRNNTSEFENLKIKYINTYSNTNLYYNSQYRPSNVDMLDPTDLKHVKRLINDSLMEVNAYNMTYNLIVPTQIQNVLFDDWEHKANVSFLLWQYAKDMDLSTMMITENGTKYYIIRPPAPPTNEKIDNGYKYTLFDKNRCVNFKLLSNASDGVDEETINYNRTAASFACMTIFMMSLGFFFSLYTFLNPRYMFKRLAGGINFISASTSFVVIQSIARSFDYEQDHFTLFFPKGSDISYGYAFYVAYIVFASNLIGGLMFMWYSGKKKGSKAPTDEIGLADEPTIIGR